MVGITLLKRVKNSMSTDLYIIVILLIFFVAMFLTMFRLIHLISGLIACIVALMAATPVISFDVYSHTSSVSQISIQEVNKISPKDNSDTLFDVTYTDAENIDREITVKEIVYDSDVNYIEKTRKKLLFLYEDSYILHEPQKFINNNLN